MRITMAKSVSHVVDFSTAKEEDLHLIGKSRFAHSAGSRTISTFFLIIIFNFEVKNNNEKKWEKMITKNNKNKKITKKRN